MADWRSEEQLPSAEGRWECWRPPLGRRLNGEAVVRAALRRWHPWDPLLVGIPGADKLLPPVCIPGLDHGVQSRTLFHYRLLLALLSALTIAAYAAASITGAHQFTNAAISGVLLFAFVLLQYTAIFRVLGTLRETSRFVSWVYLEGMSSACIVFAAMVCLGAIQYWLEARAGGLETLITQVGLVFDLARQHPWRYVTGPFLHSGVVHWASNATLLVFAAGLGSTFGRRITLAGVFFAGVMLPALLLAILPYSIRSDAFVGISGGIMSLLGWITGVGIRERAWFPRHFALVMGAFSVVVVSLSSLLSLRANSVVHIVGLLIGLVAGFMTLGWKHRT